MNDIEYTLRLTNKERKITAYSARHKKNGSKSKRCTLPSDNLTAAQKKGLNGEVTTYEMGKPHTWKELKMWPTDLRKQYFDSLITKMEPSGKDLGLMLNVTPTYVSEILKGLGIRRNARKVQLRTDEQMVAWQRFLNGEIEPAPIPEPEPDLIPAPGPEPTPGMPTYDSFETAEIEEQTDPAPTPTIITPPNYMCFTLEGTAEELIRLLETGKAMFSGKYSISVSLKRCDE